MKSKQWISSLAISVALAASKSAGKFRGYGTQRLHR